MREIGPDQAKIASGIGHDRTPDLPDTAAFVDEDQLPFRMEVPVKIDALFGEGPYGKSPAFRPGEGFPLGSVGWRAHVYMLITYQCNASA